MQVSPHLLKVTIYSVGTGGQISWVFDPRPLSYLEHCRLRHGPLFIGMIELQNNKDNNLLHL